LRRALSAQSIDDAATRARIRSDFERYGRIWCPHTAVAAEAYTRLEADQRARGRWVVVATAHPAKFREIVEPAIGQPVPLPPILARLFERPTSMSEIEPTLADLRRVLFPPR
jgi:threonine synthase